MHGFPEKQMKKNAAVTQTHQYCITYRDKLWCSGIKKSFITIECAFDLTDKHESKVICITALFKILRWLYIGWSFQKEFARSPQSLPVIRASICNYHSTSDVSGICFYKLVHRIKKNRWYGHRVRSFSVGLLKGN